MFSAVFVTMSKITAREELGCELSYISINLDAALPLCGIREQSGVRMVARCPVS
jgi:hypothetical protein